MNDKWKYVPFSKLFTWCQKSNIGSREGLENGLYPLYIASATEIKRYDEFLENGEALIFGTGGNPCIHYVTGKYAYTNHTEAAKRQSEEINTKFYYYYFQKDKYSLLASTFVGGGIKNSSKKKIGELPVPIVDITEQKRIVSRIEELFSQLDDGVETLKKTKAQLAVYRQAVLKEAFASVEMCYYDRLNSVIVGSPQNGLYKPKSDYCDDGTPILRIDGFYDGFILGNYQFKHVNLTDDEMSHYSLEIGDLIINRVNSMPYLGKCALIRSLNETTVFESNMMRIKLDASKVNGTWLSYYLSSYIGRKELTKNAKQAVNQASINQIDVGNAIVPLPPIDVQIKCVHTIEARLSVCVSIEKAIDTTLQQADALRQSILKDAFEGRHDGV